MNKIKITYNVPYLIKIDENYNAKEYKKVYEYCIIVNNKHYSFTKKRDLKKFLYEKIQDKTFHDVNELTGTTVSCVVTNRSIINDVIRVHVYNLFNITPFWYNY